MKRKTISDMNKAKSLLEMAQKTFERLKTIDKLKYASNTLEDYYNILHQLMESLSSIKGIKFSGENAHKELIDYISKEFSLPENERIFLQEMRVYRNKISYEGFFVKDEYIKRNEVKIEDIIKFFETKILESFK